MEHSQIKSNTSFSDHSPLNGLIKLIEALRGVDGCPWDKKQTPDTLAIYLIEEVYELVDAIESGNPQEIREELGDVLFHIFFVAAMFQEMGHFDIQGVAESIIEKMIRRHPHVFGSKKLKSPEKVKEQWHTIKMKEKENQGKPGTFSRVTEHLPALMRAYRISERASRIGLDWNHMPGVLEKAEEEWSEFKAALLSKNNKETLLEFGDILFTLVNVARFAKIHPETALTASIKKFEKRLKVMEKIASDKGVAWDSFSPDEIDALWKETKKNVEG